MTSECLASSKSRLRDGRRTTEYPKLLGSTVSAGVFVITVTVAPAFVNSSARILETVSTPPMLGENQYEHSSIFTLFLDRRQCGTQPAKGCHVLFLLQTSKIRPLVAGEYLSRRGHRMVPGETAVDVRRPHRHQFMKRDIETVADRLIRPIEQSGVTMSTGYAVALTSVCGLELEPGRSVEGSRSRPITLWIRDPVCVFKGRVVLAGF